MDFKQIARILAPDGVGAVGRARLERDANPLAAKREHVLTKPAHQLTDADLNAYLDLAIQRKIPLQHAQAFLAALSDDQRTRLGQLIAAVG